MDYMYSKLPPEDEQFIYSKHVEDIYWSKFRKKVHLIGSYYANILQCIAHIMSNLSMPIWLLWSSDRPIVEAAAYTTNTRRTSMPSAAFELAIPDIQLQQAYTLVDGTANGIGFSEE